MKYLVEAESHNDIDIDRYALVEISPQELAAIDELVTLMLEPPKQAPFCLGSSPLVENLFYHWDRGLLFTNLDPSKLPDEIYETLLKFKSVKLPDYFDTDALSEMRWHADEPPLCEILECFLNVRPSAVHWRCVLKIRDDYVDYTTAALPILT